MTERNTKTELAAVSAELPEISLSPGLHLVAMPLGNPMDIGLRALATLKAAARIATEDTRVSGPLLAAYGIRRPLISYHSYNAEARDAELIAAMAQGESLALISDAGMPLISDPGASLVRACIAAGIPVTAVPGPSAGITALSASGLDAGRYKFYGFPPKKKGRLRRVLQDLLAEPSTLIFYEAPARVPATLRLLAEAAPERLCVLAREITKPYESYYRGTTTELAETLHDGVKGECMILLEGLEAFKERKPAVAAPEPQVVKLLAFALNHGLSRRDSLELLRTAGLTVDKNEIYTLTLKMKEGEKHE